MLTSSTIPIRVYMYIHVYLGREVRYVYLLDGNWTKSAITVITVYIYVYIYIVQCVNDLALSYVIFMHEYSCMSRKPSSYIV